MSARVLFLTGLALLALSAPAARACNITADVDHAVRMTSAEQTRSIPRAQLQRTKAAATAHGTHRVGDPWPSARQTVQRAPLRDYPR